MPSDPDQLAKPHILMAPSYTAIYSTISDYSVSGSEVPDQSARMRRLVWAFTVRIGSEGTILHGASRIKKCIYSGVSYI